MQRRKSEIGDLLDQLEAEASGVQAVSLSGPQREQLEAIRQRIRELRVAYGQADG